LALGIITLAAAAALTAGIVLQRRRAAKVERSWRALAAAVPDRREEVPASYRNVEPDATALIPHSRVALELSEQSRRVWGAQSWFGILAGPMTAVCLGLLPMAVIGPWSAFVGAALGLGMGATVLDDNRRTLTGLGLLSLLIVPLTPWGWIAGVATYAAGRGILELKDLAGRREAETERLADARYLGGSLEKRAAAVARRRGSRSGDITTVGARDPSRV